MTIGTAVVPRELVETTRRRVVRLGADPSFLASQGLAEREHVLDHAARDSLPLQRGRHADFVDIELGRLVRMPVNDRGHLGDHFAVVKSDQHVMPGLRQIGDETIRIDRLVEYVRGDAIEQRFVAGFDLSELEVWRRHGGAFL